MEQPSKIMQGVQAWRVRYPVERVTPAHSHPEDQLFSLESGLAVIKTEEGHWTVPPGRVGWIPAGHRHSLQSCGRMSGWSLYLVRDVRRSGFEKPTIFSRSTLLQEIALRMVEWSAGRKPPEEIQSHLLTVLWDELRQAESAPLHLPFPADPKLRHTMQQLSTKPSARHTVAELAHIAAMSERSFLRKFQAETGLTVGRWQQQLRVLIALEHLSKGKSVTETAFDVGFGNVSAFIRLFKRTVGETPAVYCRKSRKK